MAVLAFPYSVRDSNNTSTDNRKTGLAPTIADGKTLAASPATVTASGKVSVVEVGAGDYVALYDAETNGDASFPVDWGSALGNPNDRYGTLILTRDAGRVLSALPASGTLAVKPAVTLAAADVSGVLTANATQFAGQAITAAAPVTVPASIGTSTYAGADSSGVTTLLSRVTGTVTSPDNAGIAAIKAKTDNLAPLSQIASASDVLAIKAKTDNLVTLQQLGANPQTINLAQSLTDVSTPTLGGALNGMHAIAWCKQAIVGNVLRVFSYGSGSTPKATFALDNGDNPKTRTPQ